MMELLDLRVFAKLSELMNVSATAEVLGMPKSTTSRSVTRLETHLGVALVYRSNRRLALTETGMLFAQEARRILDAIHETEQKVGQAGDCPRGLLRVSAPVTAGQRIIAPLVAGYLALYPEMNVALTLTDGKVELMAEDVDVVIRTGDLEDSRLQARRLGTVTLSLLATPAYLHMRGTPGTPADLSDHVLLDTHAGPVAWTMHREEEVRTVQGCVRFSTNDTDTLRTVILRDMGIGWLPDYLCRDDLAAGRLVRVLPEWDGADWDVHAVFPRHRTVSPKIRSFVDFLLGELVDMGIARPVRRYA